LLSSEGRMELVPVFEGELRYTSLELLAYEAGGQLYGTMEGGFGASNCVEPCS
jgi:hypothetical protein